MKSCFQVFLGRCGVWAWAFLSWSPMLWGSREGPVDDPVRLNFTFANVGNASLDDGGEFGFTHYYTSLNSPAVRWGVLSIGLGLAYDYEDYRFEGFNRFQDGWEGVHRFQLSAPIFYRVDEDWQVMLIPSLGFAREGELKWGAEDLNVGLVASVGRSFGRERFVGLGFGVFDGFDETSGFGFVAVRWRFGEDWLIANPFRPGPTGSAGLELSWSGLQGYEIGVGGSYRKFTFRLDDSGLAPGGTGEVLSVPVWLRVTAILSREVNLNLYGGAALFGEVTARDAERRRLARDDFDPGLLIAINTSIHF